MKSYSRHRRRSRRSCRPPLLRCSRQATLARTYDLGRTPDGPTRIYSDSKSCVDLSYDPVSFKKTKHILRAAEFLRDLVARQVVTLRHVKGVIMLADILTKGTARAIFLELLSLLDSYSTSGEESLSSSSD